MGNSATSQQKLPESATTEPAAAAAAAASDEKPKKKICCACPETKKQRDECIVKYGEAACTKWIEAHKQCLRAEGFNI